MKKLFALICALFSLICLVACNNNANDNNGAQQEPENVQQDTVKESDDVFGKFDKALNDAGIKFEKTKKAAELIGGIDGYGYTTEYGSFELYKFEGDNLKQVANSKKVTLEGFGDFPVSVNGELVLLEQESIDDIKSIFESL